LETGVVISDAETSATIGTGVGMRSLFTAQTVYQWMMRLAFLVIYFLLLKWSFGTNPGRLASHQPGVRSSFSMHSIELGPSSHRCEMGYQKSLRKTGLLGSVNAMIFWRPSQNYASLLRLEGEGRLQQGICGKLPWAASVTIFTPKEELKWRKSLCA
jgi:hypothetical protein